MSISIHNINSHTSGSPNKENIIPTNKASGLTARNTPAIRKANTLFAGAEGNKYEAYFTLYSDWVASGVKSAQAYALALSTNDNITTALPKKQTEEVLSAIKRCVNKYGSISKVKSEHAKWCKNKKNKHTYAYPDVSNLKKFAPEGQRAKNNEPKVSLKRADARKALIKAGFSAHAAETALNICGVK